MWVKRASLRMLQINFTKTVDKNEIMYIIDEVSKKQMINLSIFLEGGCSKMETG